MLFKNTTDEPSPPTVEISLDQLSNYATKLTADAETMSRYVEEAIVYYPLTRFQHTEIVDTTGLNDEDSLTINTFKALNEASIILFTLLATSPFSSYESEILYRIPLKLLARTIFVVNGLDMIRNQLDKEKLINAIILRVSRSLSHRLTKDFGDNDSIERKYYASLFSQPIVVGISAYEGISAKLLNDLDALGASGLPTLEAEIERILGDINTSDGLERILKSITPLCGNIVRFLDYILYTDSPLVQSYRPKNQENRHKMINYRQEIRNIQDYALSLAKSLDSKSPS